MSSAIGGGVPLMRASTPDVASTAAASIQVAMRRAVGSAPARWKRTRRHTTTAAITMAKPPMPNAQMASKRGGATTNADIVIASAP